MRILTSRFAKGRDEEGATLVIVVLCLIAMFGMIVLVVDVGGLLLRRRALVNGADAAALAAAKSCVLSAAVDPRSAEQAADEWAGVNVDGVDVSQPNIVQVANCDATGLASSGYVSVDYGAPQSLFFAPVLGYNDSATVTAQATAIWGPAGAANPLPLVVYANAFNRCRLDTDPIPGALCSIWEDNSNTTGNQSGFGFLDLRTGNPAEYGWDSTKGAVCSNTNVDGWIENYPDPQVGELGVNYPDPTYVCRISGNQNVAWASLEDLVDDDDVSDGNDEEDILFFPLNRCYAALTGTETNGQVGKPTPTSDPIACGLTPHQYDIVGFVAFKLKDILTSLQARPTAEPCSFVRSFPTASPLNLDTSGIFEGCFTTPPASIDPQSVQVTQVGQAGPENPSPAKAPVGSPCSAIAASYDYCYDAGSREIFWNPVGPIGLRFVAAREYDVTFKWSNGDGPCGTPPSPGAGGSAGHCLIVEYVETRIGGNGPGGGDPNSNLRAYKLCEPAVASTCAPVTVPVPPGS